MKLIVLTEKYPYINDPVFTFLRNNLIELSKLGCECEVVCPQSIIRPFFEKAPFRKKYWVDKSDDVEIKVHQPFYFSYGQFSLKKSYESFLRSAKRVINGAEEFDAFYCKFWHMGIIANELKTKKPIIIDCGESDIGVRYIFSANRIEDTKKNIVGTIYVSNKNYQEAKRKELQEQTPYIVLPNGINTEIFAQKNKEQCRRQLNWNKDAFITITVGSFTERKGVDRVCSAINKIEGDVFSCFVGDGPLKPNAQNNLFAGIVNNEELSTYLSAADVFVLPTLHEGCCNAIIEALACGLPVISSNRDFNEGILNENNSILVDPENIDEIANAIKKLKDNKELREKLSYRRQEDIEKYDIKYRSKKIYDFISGIVK